MNATATGDLCDRIAGHLDDLTRIRRDLHAHPELRFEERRTAGVVRDELTRLGVAFRDGLGGHTPGEGTGIVAHLPATVDNPGPCIGLRADMDALPIEEATGAPPPDLAASRTGPTSSPGALVGS